MPRRSGASAVAALSLAAVLTGCADAAEPRSSAGTSSTRPSSAGSSPSPTDPPTASPTREGTGRERGPRVQVDPPPDPLAQLPERPTVQEPARLAADLELVERVLADPTMGTVAVRRAAEFEQLAARMLARGPDAVTQDVLGRLSGAVAVKTRAHVEAAALLDAMSSPQSELPEWRIVAPPQPSELLRHYRDAGSEVGVPWQYLAAVHLVETRMGRIRGVSSAGALGPMQFLPTTWDIYGEGGDIEDPRDAIFAAARLLRANGAPGDMSEALWHYNPSDNYVGAVSRYAEQMTASAYRGYWHWRVLYKHVDGTYLLDVGYPKVEARLID